MEKGVFCSFKSITIPRVLPSNVFISYEFNGEHGSSPIYKADQPVLSIDFSFELIWKAEKMNLLEISLNACNNKGNQKYRLGSEVFSIPFQELEEGYESEKSISHNTVINCQCGDFVIYSTYEFDFFQPASKSIIEKEFGKPFNSPVEEYEELVRTLRAFPDSIHPISTLWGVGGLIDMISSFEDIKISAENVQTLKKLEPILPEKLANSKLFTTILTDCFSLLTDRKPIYITKDGKKGIAEDLIGRKRLSLLAVTMCNYMVENEAPEKCEQTEEAINLVVIGILKLVGHKDATIEMIVYLMSTAIYTMQFIKKKYPGKFSYLLSVMSNVLQSSIISYTEYYSTQISQFTENPKTLIGLLMSAREDLFINSVDNTFADSLMILILEFADYFIVNNWIFTSMSSTFNAEEFMSPFPDFNFPYINSLKCIVENASKIISKKIIPDEIINEMRGQFMRYTLIRLYNAGAVKCTEGDIKKVKTSNFTPERPDVYTWAAEHRSVEVPSKFTCVLPKL